MGFIAGESALARHHIGKSDMEIVISAVEAISCWASRVRELQGEQKEGSSLVTMEGRSIPMIHSKRK